MKRLETKNIRNIGIMAHVDAGKTTLSEQLLVTTGRLRQAGRIDDGDTKLDFSPEEKTRGITIDSAATCFDWSVDDVDHRVHLVDTPGHVDFTLEVERALRVLDGAVAVFCAVGGVEPQSETVWRQADRYDLPRLAFVNKMDLAGADFDAVLDAMSDRLGATPVALQRPLGSGSEYVGTVDIVTPEGCSVDVTTARTNLLERLAELDEELMAMWVDGEEPSVDVVRSVIRRLTITGTIVPVLCGSALAGSGIEPLLDAIIRYLPSPSDRPTVRGTNVNDPEVVALRSPEHEAFSGLVFKLVEDEFAGQLTFVRVYSGVLRRGDVVLDVARGETVKVGRLLQVHADEREEVDELAAGAVGAVLGLRRCEAGTTLCDPDSPVRLAPIPRPEPVVWMSIEPARTTDRVTLSEALGRLCREDPSLRLRFDDETGQSLIGGQGELHLEVVQTRLKRRHRVEAQFGRPEVAYRETIDGEARHRVRFKKQSGGPGMFAEVELRIEPAPTGDGIVFIDSITGGAIAREYVGAVEAGIHDAATAGVFGHPVTDVVVELVDGATHQSDSSALAFQLCGAQVFGEALALAGPVVLEPMMQLAVTVPRERVGEVLGEVERRRGRIEGVVPNGAVTEIESVAPLAELFGFSNALRTLCSGRASHHMELAGYQRKRR